MTIHYFLECLMRVTNINTGTHGACYFIYYKYLSAFTFVGTFPLTLDIYWDYGDSGIFITTVKVSNCTALKTFVEDRFFVRSHGVKEDTFDPKNGKKIIFVNVSPGYSRNIGTDASPYEFLCNQPEVTESRILRRCFFLVVIHVWFILDCVYQSNQRIIVIESSWSLLTLYG